MNATANSSPCATAHGEADAMSARSVHAKRSEVKSPDLTSPDLTSPDLNFGGSSWHHWRSVSNARDGRNAQDAGIELAC